MKKLILLSLIGFASCNPDNPEPNITNAINNELPCVNILWNQNIDYNSVTDVDGNTYNTVIIGEQEWMAENLKTTHYSNGDPIPYVFNGDLNGDSLWFNISTGAYCSYLKLNNAGDTINYKDCYGLLYNWYAITDSRNICPEGWHIPSDNEWDILKEYLSDSYNSPIQTELLKSLSGWSLYYGENFNGTDYYGFRAIPSGCRFSNGKFNYVGERSRFWRYIEEEIIRPGAVDFTNNHHVFHQGVFAMEQDGLSIRCIKD